MNVDEDSLHGRDGGGARRTARRRLLGLSGRMLLGLGLLAALPGSAAAQEGYSAIIGFRSALFGMDEGDIRDAIYRDFGLGDEQVEVVPNATDGTTVLRVHVEDLIEATGRARIDYVLGYARLQLMRIDLMWGTPVDPEATPDDVRRAGLLLRRYFDTLHLVPETVVENRRLESGAAILFAGQDPEGRTIAMTERVLQVQTQNGAVRTLFALRLSYIEDADNPDIYRLEPGSF